MGGVYKANSALNHPNICTLYDLGTQDGTSYLVMEYLKGKQLSGPLAWPEAKTYTLQLLDALGSLTAIASRPISY